MTEHADNLSESLENYLETIHLLSQEHVVARSKDIAERMGVNRSSVTGALQALRDRELVNYEPYGFVTLTEAGTQAATRVLRRHEALRDFFIGVLAIDEDEADEVACRLEHGISKHVVYRLIDFAHFVKDCPRAGAKWVAGSGYRCETTPPTPQTCELCVTECLEDIRKTGNRRTRPKNRGK